MECGPARFVRERHENQTTELRLAGHHDACHCHEVRTRLFFSPRRGAGCHLLQPKRCALRMTCITAGVIAALLQEDWLDLGPIRLEIQTARTRGRCRAALPLQSGT